MEPTEFLGRNQFEALTDEEQVAYLDDVVEAVRSPKTAEWVLEPEEFDGRFQTPIWDAVWTDAERIADVLRQALTVASLTRWTKPGLVRTLRNLSGSLNTSETSPLCRGRRPFWGGCLGV